MSFQIMALDHRQFSRFFAMSEQQLAESLAVRVVATKRPGFPCRVALSDAEPGDRLILVKYQHQDRRSPYRAAHAVYVKEGARTASPAIDEIPCGLLSRTLSLRVFDAQAMLIAASLVEGAATAPELDRLLADPAACHVDIHYAKFGCHAARAVRAD